MKKSLFLAVLFAVSMGIGSVASACEKSSCSGHDKQCSTKSKQCSTQSKDCSSKGQGDQQCPIIARLMKKSDFLLHYSSEIGLTADQVQKINAIRSQAQEDELQQGEGMKAFMTELEEGLKQEKVDVAAMEALIDKTMTRFSSSAKAGVQAYANLKGILTEEQVVKVKSLHQNKKSHCGGQKKSCGTKDKSCSPQGKSKKGLTPQPRKRG